MILHQHYEVQDNVSWHNEKHVKHFSLMMIQELKIRFYHEFKVKFVNKIDHVSFFIRKMINKLI